MLFIDLIYTIVVLGTPFKLINAAYFHNVIDNRVDPFGAIVQRNGPQFEVNCSPSCIHLKMYRRSV